MVFRENVLTKLSSAIIKKFGVHYERLKKTDHLLTDIEKKATLKEIKENVTANETNWPDCLTTFTDILKKKCRSSLSCIDDDYNTEAEDSKLKLVKD